MRKESERAAALAELEKNVRFFEDRENGHPDLAESLREFGNRLLRRALELELQPAADLIRDMHPRGIVSTGPKR